MPKIGNKLSLSEHAYMVLKDAILNKTFKPKDILLEESLAEMLGVSRTPLRTALKRLEFEKLIYINSSKQAVVAEISFEDMVQIFVYRYAVEPVLARVVCDLITDAYLERIEDCLERNRQAIEEKHFAKTLDCELQFDTILAECSDNEFLADSVATIHTYLRRFLTLSTTASLDSPPSLAEHGNILEALRAKDADEAEKRTRFHVRQVASRLGYTLPV